jgi:hypothetical protein
MAADVSAATAYDVADDLWVITPYFNPLGYRSRRRNYELFRSRLDAAGLPLLTVECTFGDAVPELAPRHDVLHVRARDLLWQKERLLNLAIAQLPPRCTKVAWLDADVLFENPAWAVDTSRALEAHAFVQPFDVAVRLPSGARDYRGGGEVWRGFAAVWSADREALRLGDYDRHGETGFAWAARRALLAAHGLYDACIIGGADHVMAHALCGDWTSVCIERLLGADNPHREHFTAWAQSIFAAVRGRIGYAAGTALHLWHGERAHRQYSLRHRELERFAFDPHADLRRAAGGSWEWASDKPELHRWAADYFSRRREDGAPVSAAEPRRAAGERRHSDL